MILIGLLIISVLSIFISLFIITFDEFKNRIDKYKTLLNTIEVIIILLICITVNVVIFRMFLIGKVKLEFYETIFYIGILVIVYYLVREEITFYEFLKKKRIKKSGIAAKSRSRNVKSI